MAKERFPFNSHNVAVMQAVSATVIKIDQNSVTSGRVKYLKGIIVTNTNTSVIGILQIYDHYTEESNPTATLQRMTIVTGPSETVVLEFGGKGLKFETGLVAGMTSAAGETPAYGITVWGYEE